MIKGWLIVNSFVNSSKFYEIYDLLKDSAKKFACEIEIKKSNEINTLHFEKPDFILFWDKDIDLARLFEAKGIRVFNKADAIEKCDNKSLTYVELLDTCKMPKTILGPKLFINNSIDDYSFVDTYIEELGLPLVIKESRGSFGRQVYLAKTKQEVIDIISRIHEKEYLLQEYIESSAGKDIRINIVGCEFVCAMGRVNNDDFRANITNGGHYVNVTLTDKQIDIALKACKKLDLDFAGVDILYGEDDEPILCEVNSNPHFKSSLECTGINMADYIIKHIVKTIS